MSVPPSAVRPEQGLLATGIALWPYVWPADRRDLQTRVLICLGLILLAKLATVLTPYGFKWATDALVAATGGQVQAEGLGLWLLGLPVLAVALYGIARVLTVLLTQVRDGLFAKVAMHAVRRLALETFEHMHRLSLRFHLEKKTGGLTRVLERGRTGIENLSRMFLMTLVPTIVEFVLVCAVLLIEFDLRYVLVVIVTIVLYLAFTVKATEWRIAIRRTMNESDQDSNGKAIDSLLNYETVKYFTAEAREQARYDRAMAVYETASVRTYTSLAYLNGGQAVIFTAGLTVIMALSALDVLAGRVTVGAFVLVNALMLQLYMPLNFMGMIYREIKQSLTDIETMFAILHQAPEVADPPGAPALQIRGGKIQFENVHFRYEDTRDILKGVSFEVQPGQTVAIVGPSGAGKSTISRILFRFYDIAEGRVLIDGQDIRAVSQASLRAAIGMVPQDTVLFNDTIRYNIRYGRHEASEAEVEEAARLAQIEGFVRALPQGFETQVGERGLKLSGGEKQRVAIARTLLKSPPILILDEATSALDTHTEREIQGALDTVVANRTSIVIAHRLSTVVGADQILVLKDGVIAERGTHADLLAQGGLYAAMWERQRELADLEQHLAEVRREAQAGSGRLAAE